MTKIFELATQTFYPSHGSMTLFGLMVLFSLVLFKKRKAIPKSAQKGLGGVIFCVTCVLFAGIYSEYKLYVKNVKRFERGDFKVVTGKVENILSFSGKPSQEINVNGVRLFATKGASHSFGKDFKDVFELGDVVEIYYVNKSNGIVLINSANLH